MSILIVYAFGVAIGAKIDLQIMLLIVPMILLIGALPITISGLGIREGAFVVLLTAAGVSADQAFAVALLSRLGLLFPALIGACSTRQPQAATPWKTFERRLIPTQVDDAASNPSCQGLLRHHQVVRAEVRL